MLQSFLTFSLVSLTELCSFGMVGKISSLCTNKWKKLFLTITTDDVTRGRRDVDLDGQLRVAQGRIG